MSTIERVTDFSLDPDATYKFLEITALDNYSAAWQLSLTENVDDDREFLWFTGTPLELAEFLTNAGDRISFEDVEHYDICNDRQAVIDRLTNVAVHITTPSAAAREQRAEADVYYCDNGCGDGLGDMHAGYSFMDNTWSYTLTYGCYGGNNGTSDTREDLLEDLRTLRTELHDGALKDLVKSVIKQLK